MNNKQIIAQARQSGKSYTNHLAHIQAHVKAMEEEYRRQEENKILKKMREAETFEDFLLNYRNDWKELPHHFDDLLPLVIEGLRKSFEIEKSPLAAAMREDDN